MREPVNKNNVDISQCLSQVSLSSVINATIPQIQFSECSASLQGIGCMNTEQVNFVFYRLWKLLLFVVTVIVIVVVVVCALQIMDNVIAMVYLSMCTCVYTYMYCVLITNTMSL